MNSTSWMPLLWFGVVLVLIPGALWLLKRSGLAPAGLGGAGNGMRLTGSLSIGPQQRVVTVEVGEGADRRWLVLGVTPQQISALHTLNSPPVGLAAPQPVPQRTPVGFAQVLARALVQRKATSAGPSVAEPLAAGVRASRSGDSREA